MNDLYEWIDNNDYKLCREILLNLRVVNDAAEREISTTQIYNRILTRNEEQFQYLLRNVCQNRKSVVAVKKKY